MGELYHLEHFDPLTAIHLRHGGAPLRPIESERHCRELAAVADWTLRTARGHGQHVPHGHRLFQRMWRASLSCAADAQRSTVGLIDGWQLLACDCESPGFALCGGCVARASQGHWRGLHLAWFEARDGLLMR